jgi:hypothetical protein
MIYIQLIANFVVAVSKSIFVHKKLLGGILNVKITFNQASYDFCVILLKIPGQL